MALIDRIQDSNLGLKGSTPDKGKGTDLSSDTHVFDPTPGSQGDEKIMFQSVYARTDIPVGGGSNSIGGGSDSNFETNGIATRA